MPGSGLPGAKPPQVTATEMIYAHMFHGMLIHHNLVSSLSFTFRWLFKLSFQRPATVRLPVSVKLGRR